ncbi:MAG: hypothetical protein ACYDAG_17105 [Chloroflexota bacterium]
MARTRVKWEVRLRPSAIVTWRYTRVDDSRWREPAVRAANWWRIAQHEARLAVLRRLSLHDDMASLSWPEIAPDARERIARETVSAGRDSI